ncbi:MAG: cytochrome P450 [Deltaproteobacteria bacterium]|nr:cytochrome P450 [Deltaproteobacteria bacterium]
MLSGLLEARYDDGSQIDDDTVRDHLRTLLFGGHETTATTVTWALYFIQRDPRVRARLLDELAALGSTPDPEDFPRLPYLGAVIDETLRLRPINGETLRRLAKPWQIESAGGEWEVPAGAAIAISQILLHYDERHWDRPTCFEPERFLGQHPSPFVYAPFGGGNRRCLGATFARYEATIVLGTLLREHEFELLDGDVEWRRGRATLGPVGGVRMRVRPR